MTQNGNRAHRDRAPGIRPEHHQPAREAIRDDPAEKEKQQAWHGCRDQYNAHRRARSCEDEHLPRERRQIRAVAERRDRLSQPEQDEWPRT
jgi:hypothetical protein